MSILLSNKQTGERGELHYNEDKEYRFTVVAKDPTQTRIYKTLGEVLKDWKDFIVRMPDDEPLITDPTIRRAVRAWAEVNHYDKLWVYHDPSAISFYNEDDDDNEITFNTVEKFGLEHLKCYSIIELCGEEQECES